MCLCCSHCLVFTGATFSSPPRVEDFNHFFRCDFWRFSLVACRVVRGRFVFCSIARICGQRLEICKRQQGPATREERVCGISAGTRARKSGLDLLGYSVSAWGVEQIAQSSEAQDEGVWHIAVRAKLLHGTPPSTPRGRARASGVHAIGGDDLPPQRVTCHEPRVELSGHWPRAGSRTMRPDVRLLSWQAGALPHQAARKSDLAPLVTGRTKMTRRFYHMQPCAAPSCLTALGQSYRHVCVVGRTRGSRHRTKRPGGPVCSQHANIGPSF